jgi:hypothetical protein
MQTSFLQSSWLIFFSFSKLCIGESYPPFPATIELSASQLTSAIVQRRGDLKEYKVAIKVFSRIDPSKQRHDRFFVPSESIRSGEVTSRLDFELKHEPNIVRLSDSHLALVDRYGSNLAWLKNNPAIRILSFDGTKEWQIDLDLIVPDREISVAISESRHAWLRDAWFANDGKTFYVALWINDSEVWNDTIKSIDVNNGGVRSIGLSELAEVFNATAARYHATLYDVVPKNSFNLSVERLAKSTLEDESNGLNVRVHAAAYLCRTKNEPKAVNFLHSVSALADSGVGVEVPLDLMVLKQYYEDPVAFSVAFLDTYGSSQK